MKIIQCECCGGKRWYCVKVICLEKHYGFVDIVHSCGICNIIHPEKSEFISFLKFVKWLDSRVELILLKDIYRHE